MSSNNLDDAPSQCADSPSIRKDTIHPPLLLVPGPPKAGTPKSTAEVLTPHLTAPFTAFATHLPPKEAAPTHPLFPFYSSSSLSLTPRN